MKKLYTLFFFVFIITSHYSQTVVFFDYDEAGNQILRNDCLNCPTANPDAVKKPDVILTAEEPKQQDPFWYGIYMYPVPVKDILTIVWDQENDVLIHSISLFENNSISYLIEQPNSPQLNRRLEMNMSSYRLGVYVVTFTLKDGRRVTKNIIKE